MSIVQEGHGFPLRLPAIYDYMVNRDITVVSIHDKEIPDPSVKHLIESVCQFVSFFYFIRLTSFIDCSSVFAKYNGG